MNVGTYVVATAIGILPGSFVYAYAGRQLGTINSLKEIVSPNVIGAFVLVGLLALRPVIYKRIAAKPRRWTSHRLTTHSEGCQAMIT
ncbi:MAG: hypothetical protein AB7F94_16690 [Nitrospira sp.]